MRTTGILRQQPTKRNILCFSRTREMLGVECSAAFSSLSLVRNQELQPITLQGRQPYSAIPVWAINVEQRLLVVPGNAPLSLLHIVFSFSSSPPHDAAVIQRLSLISSTSLQIYKRLTVHVSVQAAGELQRNGLRRRTDRKAISKEAGSG